jgi:hypothetical protein
MEPSLTEIVPISELVAVGQQYVCSRELFSFVNRSLNTLGLRALVMPPMKSLHFQADLVVFSVEKMEQAKP